MKQFKLVPVHKQIKRASCVEMVDLLIRIEKARDEMRAIEISDLTKLADAHEKLMTLYISLPVTDMLEFISEVGRKSKSVDVFEYIPEMVRKINGAA